MDEANDGRAILRDTAETQPSGAVSPLEAADSLRRIRFIKFLIRLHCASNRNLPLPATVRPLKAMTPAEP